MTETPEQPELSGHWPPAAVPSSGQPPWPAGYGPPGVGYGPPGWGYGAAPQQGRKTNVVAIVGLVAIFVFTPAALVLGLVARSQIAKSGEDGEWMAWVSIALGLLGTLVYLAGAVILILLLGGGDWYD